MITRSMMDRFLEGVRGQALREGTRYAREARVQPFTGAGSTLSTIVRGQTGEFEVFFSLSGGVLVHDCNCPSWRSPCKHEVAAAEVLRQTLPAEPGASGSGASVAEWRGHDPGALPTFDPGALLLDIDEPDPEEVRADALEERRLAARREPLEVAIAGPAQLEVRSASAFVYRVNVRGGPDGPHSCTCPDFEANRLHTCKHVERVRTYLARRGGRLEPAFRRAAAQCRIYLHFGETVEPRLFLRPAGRAAEAVSRAFGGDGRPRGPVPANWPELRRWLEAFGPRVEPEALAWVDRRIDWMPRLSRRPFREQVRQVCGTPYPYQWEGAEFLARRGRALLADEMGLGKTVQAIVAAAALRRARNPARHVTVVCPASLRGGWQDEIGRWIGEEVVLLTGRARERARIIASRPAWLITHYEQVLRDHRYHAAAPPDLLIIDEAQRAKGLQTRTARTLKAIGSRYLFALTGTPLENRLEEAYAIAQLIDQRMLPPLWQIERDHFVRLPGSRQVQYYRDVGELRSRLAPAFLRRRKEDVALELPERVRSIARVEMHPAVEDTYEEVMAQVARIARRKVILPPDLERMMRLLVIARRCCNGPHMLGQEIEHRKVPKLAELEDVLRELCLGEGRKAVVFSEWTDMTHRVEELCRGLKLPVFHLHGDVIVRRRPALIRSFTEREGPAVFVSTDAGGLGLNLQAADVLVNLDLPWNPARLEQRIARIHRIGSKRTVQILLLVCRQSIEERIMALHATKENVFQNLFGDNGEDVLVAPGGSGAFQNMVRALVEASEVQEVDGDETAPAEPPETWGEVASGTTATDDGTSGTRPASGPPRKLATTAARRPAAAPAASPPVQEPAPPPAPCRAPAAAVDPAAVAAAVAAVAPTLPEEHRRSLATVFRALADALEEHGT